MRRRVGLGLVEAMIALAICAALLTAVAGAFTGAAAAVNENDEFFQATQTGRVALNRILTQVRRGSVDSGSTTTSLHLITDTGSDVTYNYDANAKTITMVIRLNGVDTSYSLARNVSTCTFNIQTGTDYAGQTCVARVAVNIAVQVFNNQVLLSGTGAHAAISRSNPRFHVNPGKRGDLPKLQTYWISKSMLVPSRTRSTPPRPSTVRRGFTLIEAALTTAITGIAFVAIMQLFASCTQQNRVGSNMTSAMMLAGHIQETMTGLSFNDPALASTYFGAEPGQTLGEYDDVDDFDDRIFNPPIDSLRQAIPDQNQFTQLVSVMPVYATQLTSNTDPSSPTIAKTTYTGAVRVLVRIMYRVKPTDGLAEVYRTSWIRVDE